MHAIEKILAKHSGKASVHAGEIVTAKVDFAEINDLYLQTITSFYEMGGKKIWDRSKAAFVFDHYAPCPTVKTAQNHKEMREFVKANNMEYHFDTGVGVCHQVMPEAGVVRPGMILVATDSHTTTHGAFGALGTGCGATDMACILLEGQLWFKVPEVIKVNLNGKAPEGVYPKDVILTVLGKVRADGAVYKAVEFAGSYIEELGVPGRMTICNMAVEMGAKTAYMQPNQAVLDYVNARCKYPYDVEFTDPDYKYSEEYNFDVSAMEPMVSRPSSVENVYTLASTVEKKIPIHQGYLGSCTNGRTEDLTIAANILKGKHIAPFTRFVVVPASNEVLQECMANGVIQTLVAAGATLTTPGCAACLGTHEGILAPGENCVTSTNRNFPGRMGSKEASLYLASPATVAASVLTGYLTDARSL